MITEAQLRNCFLVQRQGLPLHFKIEMTLRRIRYWYDKFDGNIHVCFSGGADSTVLLFLARCLYPEIKAVFVDTGVEYPEIRQFVRTVENVVWMKPKMTYKQVLAKHGYLVVGKETSQKIYEARNTKSDFLRELRTTGVEGRKRQAIPAKHAYLVDAPFKISHKCCHILKHEPLDRYAKQTGSMPMTGEMAFESAARTQKIAEHGCFFMGKLPRAKPMSFWTPTDSHLILSMLPHCVLYDLGFTRTGCFPCAAGVEQNSPNKFQVMKKTHPRLHAKALPAFGINDVLKFMGVPIE